MNSCKEVLAILKNGYVVTCDDMFYYNVSFKHLNIICSNCRMKYKTNLKIIGGVLA